MIVLKLRRDVAADWRTANPILSDGEPGYESDTGKLKIGDGATRWLGLGYFNSGAQVPTDGGVSDAVILAHINDVTPHPVYDDLPSLTLLFENGLI